MYQRLRDPVHDLIEFDDSPFERMIWRLLEQPEFQRLRRIRQLGFSDLVFPGATHSRFAHSVGVFHTARILGNVLKEKLGKDFDRERAEVAMCAALVHDLGHGPFSHAFEHALNQVGRHEDWTEKAILQTQIARIMNDYKRGFCEEVSAIFRSETSPDIYSSIVSSQFDADRLDYMRRDRQMTGTHLGGIDFTWLMSNLEVTSIEVGSDEQNFARVSTFALGQKALWAGEAYVLSLFHLYPAVYLHKTTRGAEKLFSSLLQALRSSVDERRYVETGLPENHPLIRYLKEQSLSSYQELDDSVIWGSLSLLAGASNASIAEPADRLRKRNLYKAYDIRSILSGGRIAPGDEVEQKARKFNRCLAEKTREEQSLQSRILIDRFERDPYKKKSYDSPKAIERIHIMIGGEPRDLSNESVVVGALKPFSMFRIYIAREDESANKTVAALIEEAKR